MLVQWTHTSIALLCLVVTISTKIFSDWPSDDETLGMMGCRFFRYQGEWETKNDSNYEQDNTSAMCLTVALASIINYHRWPKVSFFDGFYISEVVEVQTIPLYHRWNYTLINGPLNNDENCFKDRPSLRYDPNNINWSGIDEIQKLIYTVERSFGKRYSYFMNKHQPSKDEYFPLHHVLKNRFGYAGCRIIDIDLDSNQHYIQDNLMGGLPVVILEDYHSYVLDGCQPSQKNRPARYHSTDYYRDSSSMGWFNWETINNQAIMAIVDINPTLLLKSLTKGRSITYSWGNRCIPFTSFTQRKGFITIESEDSLSLGNIDYHLQSIQGDTNTIIFSNQTNSQGLQRIRIPEYDSFTMDIQDSLHMQLSISNLDPWDKRVRVTFHDFAKDHDISETEKKLCNSIPLNVKQNIFPGFITVQYTNGFLNIFGNPLTFPIKVQVFTPSGKCIITHTSKNIRVNNNTKRAVPLYSLPKITLSKGIYVVHSVNGIGLRDRTKLVVY